MDHRELLIYKLLLLIIIKRNHNHYHLSSPMTSLMSSTKEKRVAVNTRLKYCIKVPQGNGVRDAQGKACGS